MHICLSLLVATAALFSAVAPAQAQDKKPNIVFIMGDDIGMWNIGAYHRGMMAGRDAEPRQARQGRHAVHRLLRRGELHGGSRELHHRRTADSHGHDHGRPGGRARPAFQPRLARSPPRSKRRATRPASSARITWAISMSSCRRSTGSTSSSAISITSMRWKTRRIPTTRRTCWTKSARATWFTSWATDYG